MHSQNFYWQNDTGSPFCPQLSTFYNPLPLSCYPPQIHNNLYNIITSTHLNSQLNHFFQPSCFTVIDPSLLYNFSPPQPLQTPTTGNTNFLSGQCEMEGRGGEAREAETVVKAQHQEEYGLDENTVPRRQNKRKYRHHRHHRRINAASYYWSIEQNKRYYDFLKNHAHLFELTLSEKKNLRVNVMMSKKVKTRNSQQCHSHHQKMIKKYGSVDRLLSQMTFESIDREQHRLGLRKSKKNLIPQDQQESEFKI